MCEHDNTENRGHIYEEGYLVEYNVHCIDCGGQVGTWAYGSYYEADEGDSN